MLLLRCAARSARARPLRASYGVVVTCSSPPANRAFGTSAADATRNAADVRDLLRTRLSLTDAEVDKVVRFRPVGARATVEPKLQWLQARLDLDAAQLGKMVLRLPPLLSKSVESMDSRLDWLQRRLGLDEAGLRKMVLSLPSLLSYSVEDNMEPKLDWLQDRLELDAAQLKKMVLTLPALLSYSAEANMAPKLAYLERETGLSRSELRDRVLRFPQFMSYSLEKRYRPRLEACRAAGVDAEYVLTYVSKTDEKFYELLETKKDAVGEPMR